MRGATSCSNKNAIFAFDHPGLAVLPFRRQIRSIEEIRRHVSHLKGKITMIWVILIAGAPTHQTRCTVGIANDYTTGRCFGWGQKISKDYMNYQ